MADTVLSMNFQVSSLQLHVSLKFLSFNFFIFPFVSVASKVSVYHVESKGQ